MSEKQRKIIVEDIHRAFSLYYSIYYLTIFNLQERTGQFSHPECPNIDLECFYDKTKTIRSLDETEILTTAVPDAMDEERAEISVKHSGEAYEYIDDIRILLDTVRK